MRDRIRIATRSSPLALLQTQAVVDSLLALQPELTIEIIPIITAGDQLQRTTVNRNFKAMFVSELQQALLSGQADIAVHSLKDMAIKPQNRLAIIACLPRADPSDALVSNKYTALADLPAGAVIGTASSRRQSLLKKYYPQLRVKEVRGNIATRLKKLNEDFDAIILATNGLQRLAYNDRITERLSTQEFVPAIGQAVVAIEADPENKYLTLVQKINHSATFLCVQIERHIGALLGADCGVPIAVHVEIIADNDLDIRAVSAVSGFRMAHQRTSLTDLAQTIQLIVNQLS